MSWLIGKPICAQRALMLAILTLVAVEGPGLGLASSLNRPAIVWRRPLPISGYPVATWGRPVIIADRPVVAPHPHGIAQQDPTQADLQRAATETKRQAEEARKQRLLIEAQRNLAMAESEEHRKKAEILSDKMDGLLKSMAEAQLENKALQERAEAERRQAETDRKLLQEETAKRQQLAETQRQLQQKQAEEQRQQAELRSDKVDSSIQVVAADVKKVLHVAQNTQSPPATPSLQAARTSNSDALSNPLLILGGLFVVLIAGWFATRSIKTPVSKITGLLDVMIADVKNLLQATQKIEEVVGHEREAQYERVEEQPEPQPETIDAQETVQRDRVEPERKNVGIGTNIEIGTINVGPQVRTNPTAGIEFAGDRLIDDLAFTVKEMLAEVSQQNREGDRFHASLQKSSGRDDSR